MMKTGENVREVNRQSDLPLYKQIMDIIQEEIDKKILLPGEQLTPEIELAQHFNVSRMTIRPVSYTHLDLYKRQILAHPLYFINYRQEISCCYNDYL